MEIKRKMKSEGRWGQHVETRGVSLPDQREERKRGRMLCLLEGTARSSRTPPVPAKVKPRSIGLG